MWPQLARIGGKITRCEKRSRTTACRVGHRAVDEARQALRAALIAKPSASPSDEELQRVSRYSDTDERRGKK
jgi:hypothetical protein